jgi:GNAT superfamily N-acetyltransferase
MTCIHQAETEEDRLQVGELFWEYLQWADERLIQEFEVKLDIVLLHEQAMAELEVFSPPHGRLLLATDESQATGVACLKRIREGMGEIKRMYVRPEFRGQGIGRLLLEALISEAQQIGYQALRLDSTRFMKRAHSLYRSAGFREIEPYPESEIPPEFHKHWVFMEKQL